MQKNITITYDASGIKDFSAVKKLKTIHDTLSRARKSDSYDDPYSFVYLPLDNNYYEIIQKCVAQKQALAYSAIVVLGIGGSSLGAQAIHSALQGAYWNEYEKPQVYFVDTLDPYETAAVLHIVEEKLKKEERILLVIISKTGTTLETITHYTVFSALVKKYYSNNHQEYIIVISDEHSELADYAQRNNYAFLPIPKPIGGRYSVFTAVGICVLALLGIDTNQLRLGACAAVDNAFDSPLEQNNAALSALCIYEQYQSGSIILDYFIFLKVLAGTGTWYRQLIGESLGKKTFNNTYCRLLPTVTVGSNDLHAVAQLYLGGLPPVFTQFVTVNNFKKDIAVPTSDFGKDLSTHTYSELMNILFQATKRAYDEQKRPYLHIQLPEYSTYYLGQLLQFHMLQVVYLAELLEVNPFDQPHVELYKKYVRQMIGG